MYKVIVCGDRNWTNVQVIEERLLQFDPRTTMIIEGGCRGADSIAHQIATTYGFANCHMNANWDVYNKAAGPIRNSWMLALEPDIVLAFHNDLANSKGTMDTVRKARKADIKIEVVVDID